MITTHPDAETMPAPQTATSKPATRGAVLIATSHPYYGRMAANLANTIKAAAPDFPVAVIADEIGLHHLNAAELGLFSRVIKTDKGGRGLAGALRLRLNLPNLSPFDETLSLDVDMLWLPGRDPRALFSLLEGRDFTIVNEGFTDLENDENSTPHLYTHWGKPDEIAAAYGLTGKLYAMRGEFMLFRKSEPVVAMFKQAREILRHPKISPQLLAGGVTDEFALNIAANLARIEPHQPEWQPAFWPALRGGLMPQINKLAGYYAVSFGGHDLPENSVRTYEILAKAAAYQTKVRYRFPIRGKRDFLPERQKL
jgi:hypothetical protein